MGFVNKNKKRRRSNTIFSIENIMISNLLKKQSEIDFIFHQKLIDMMYPTFVLVKENVTLTYLAKADLSLLYL